MKEQELRQLAQRFRIHNDHAAFQTLLEACKQSVWRYTYYSVSPNDVEDVFQKACMTFAQSLSKKLPANVQAHFMVIARNKIFDYYREQERRQNETSLEDLAAQTGFDPIRLKDPVSEMAAREKASTVLFQCGLTDEQREAVILHHGLGYAIDEVAGLTGVSFNTVKTRIFMAKKKMKRHIEERGMP